MKDWAKSVLANAGVIGEIFILLWKRKLWWLTPMVAALLIIGLILVFTSASGIGPFIYTLF
jgi:hypothetical protein